MILLFLGCTLSGAPSPCVPDDQGLVVATTTDFSAGAIAAIVEGDLDDGLAPVGGDPVVVGLTDGRIAMLERSGGHHLRLYTPGCWDVPDVEVALEGANPHGAALHEDVLWVTAYDAEPSLRLFDPVDGASLGGVDLSAYADADGLVEADEVLVHDDRLWVALQRLERVGPAWPDGGGGRVVVLDADTRGVVDVYDVGPNPKIATSTRGVIVWTGVFGGPDGALGLLEGPPRVTEAELGFDLQHYVEVGEIGVLVGVDFEANERSRVRCYDWTSGTLRDGWDTDVWLADAVAEGERVWLASRSTASAPDHGDGLIAFDPVSCSVIDTLPTALEPFSLTTRPAR